MDQYPQQLADAVESVLATWLTRCVLDTARRVGSATSPDLLDAARDMSRAAAPLVMTELRNLLVTDVDDQRSNPLSVLRHAVHYPTAVLHAAGFTPVQRDEFAIRAFPADVYNLSPATWADIDESLVEPGLIWGAWKAKTVLDRRKGRTDVPATDS